MKTYFGKNCDPNFGRCQFTCHSNLRRSQNITIDGVVMNGNCYTYPLILPEVDFLDPVDDNQINPKATSMNCIDYALVYDHDFVKQCDDAVTDAVAVYKKETLQALAVELALPPAAAISCRQVRISNYFDHLKAPVAPPTAISKYLAEQQNQDPDFPSATDPKASFQAALAATPFRELILQSIPVNKIRVETERILWHQRLGHPCDEYLYSAHKFIDGVPKFKRRSDVMSKCSTCIKAKMTKNSPGPNSTKRALHHGQGLSIDFSFSGVKSKNTSRRKDFVGINGETSWLLITDHHTGMEYGQTFCSKASPVEWIREWLQVHAPCLRDKYVFMDQGGELFGNPDIINVFRRHHYEIHPTGTDASHQNGPVERAHRVIGDHVRALLIGANLNIKFWPYAFFHHLRINNAMAMNGQDSSRIFQATGKKENFTGFRTFGCRTWIRPPGKRSAKFKHNIVKGIFLGFIPRTKRNILWYNCETSKIGDANHVTFDEGMNDLPFKMLPPNQRDLERAEYDKFPAEPDEVNVEEDLQFYLYPFAKMESKRMRVLSDCSRPNFGLVIERDPQYNRAYVLDVDTKSSAAKLCSSLTATRRAIKGSYIVEIAGHRIFTKSEAIASLAKLCDAGVL